MKRKKIIYSLITILTLIAIDQISKNFLIIFLKTQPGYVLELLPVLDLVYAWNYGVSFGLFRGYYQYSNILFLILNSLISVYLCYLMIRTKTHLSWLGIVFIISGAIGNIIDRMIHGAVFDFLYFHYQDFTFPAFNIADSFITIGVMFFIYDYIFTKKRM